MQRIAMLAVVTLVGLTSCVAQPAEAPTWVEVDGTIYGAKADETGPIGGGAGYANIVTEGDSTASTLEALIEALAQAQASETVFIPGETHIDLTTFIYIEQLVLEIPGGVTLAGNRGQDGSLGAILTSDALNTKVMIRALGPGVRVTGLRIQGPNTKRYIPHHTRAYGGGGTGAEYYYKLPTQSGIQTEHDGLEVDNCDISGFGLAGVNVLNGTGLSIHHNYIHHCQYQGLGYGVCIDTGTSAIEFNIFDWNRHSIAGTGRSGGGYVARNNVELGVSLSHCFDMHGGRDRGDGTNVAGTSIEISNNTFRAPVAPIVIRGEPEDACQVHHNWFPMHAGPANAVSAEASTIVTDNAYGTEATVIE